MGTAQLTKKSSKHKKKSYFIKITLP